MRKSSRRSRAGYSLIEVMMALGVLTSGAVGIMALQQSAMRGNLESRQISTGTGIARTMIERLKRDATLWNTGANAADLTALANTCYLRNPPDPGNAVTWRRMEPAAGNNCFPVTTARYDNAGESYAFDHYGNEVAPASPDVRFCAQYRLQWITPGQSMRADVRVWWHRTGSASAADGIGNAANYVACGGDGEQAAIGADPGVHTVSASTMLRWVPQ